MKRRKTKDLNTYANNICSVHIPDWPDSCQYQGMEIIVSNSAMRELFKEGKTLYDVVEVLKLGRKAPRKRKKGIIEKWHDKGNKTFNAVIAKNYNEMLKKECWILIHFGKFAWRKNEMP